MAGARRHDGRSEPHPRERARVHRRDPGGRCSVAGSDYEPEIAEARPEPSLTTQARLERRASASRPLFVAGLAIVLLPVAIRNYAVGGGFYLTTSQFGPNFYIGNNPNADGTYHVAPLRSRRAGIRAAGCHGARRARHRAPLTPAEVSSYWTDRALDFITRQPRSWLRAVRPEVRAARESDGDARHRKPGELRRVFAGCCASAAGSVISGRRAACRARFRASPGRIAAASGCCTS